MKLNRPFNTKLLDKNSQEFTTLVSEGVKHLLRGQVTDFRSSSIAVDFNIILNETNRGGKFDPDQALITVRNVIRSGNVASLNPNISALPTIQGTLKYQHYILLQISQYKNEVFHNGILQ